MIRFIDEHRDQFGVEAICRILRPAVRGFITSRFTAPRPRRLCVADVTYVATWPGFAYVAFVTDVYSRRIVGCARSPRTAGISPTKDAVVKLLWLAICDIDDKRARQRAKERGQPAG